MFEQNKSSQSQQVKCHEKLADVCNYIKMFELINGALNECSMA